MAAAAPGLCIVSTNRSTRLPGASATRPSRATKGSAGWPSMAMTHGEWRSIRREKPRAPVALIRRRRIRSPAFTGISGRTDPLTRTNGADAAELAGHSEHQHDIRVDLDRLGLVDDQRAMEAAIDLAGGMGVVPEGARIGRAEHVVEARAGRDRRLGEVRDAVHGIGQPDAVPVDAGRLGKLVHEPDAELLAALEPQRRARCGTAIAPARRLSLAARRPWAARKTRKPSDATSARKIAGRPSEPTATPVPARNLRRDNMRARSGIRSLDRAKGEGEGLIARQQRVEKLRKSAYFLVCAQQCA